MSSDCIVVRGARVHNLKNIDFEIEHNTLTVVTGVSGSGNPRLRSIRSTPKGSAVCGVALRLCAAVPGAD